MGKSQIVNSIYAAYGSDSGVLFGIKERSIVEYIVDFTLRKVAEPQDDSFVVWKDGSFKRVTGETYEYENDKDWLVTINP